VELEIIKSCSYAPTLGAKPINLHFKPVLAAMRKTKEIYAAYISTFIINYNDNTWLLISEFLVKNRTIQDIKKEKDLQASKSHHISIFSLGNKY